MKVRGLYPGELEATSNPIKMIDPYSYFQLQIGDKVYTRIIDAYEHEQYASTSNALRKNGEIQHMLKTWHWHCDPTIINLMVEPKPLLYAEVSQQKIDYSLFVDDSTKLKREIETLKETVRQKDNALEHHLSMSLAPLKTDIFKVDKTAIKVSNAECFCDISASTCDSATMACTESSENSANTETVETSENAVSTSPILTTDAETVTDMIPAVQEDDIGLLKIAIDAQDTADAETQCVAAGTINAGTQHFVPVADADAQYDIKDEAPVLTSQETQTISVPSYEVYQEIYESHLIMMCDTYIESVPSPSIDLSEWFLKANEEFSSILTAMVDEIKLPPSKRSPRTVEIVGIPEPRSMIFGPKLCL